MRVHIEPWLKHQYSRVRQVRQFLRKEVEINGVPLAPWKWRFLARGFHSDKRYLYALDRDGLPRLAYLSDLARLRTRRLNGSYRSILNDKWMFKEAMAGVLRCPRSFGTVSRGVFSAADQTLAKLSGAPFSEVIHRLPLPIVVKPLDRGGGRDVHRLERVGDDLLVDGAPIALADFPPGEGHSFLIEEAIVQGRYANNLYPRSVNTIRMLTINDGRTPPWIAFAVQRIGQAVSVPTDNFNRGGLCSAIDIETGRLSAAFCFTEGQAPTAFERHPETRAQIAGLTVPDWQAIKAEILDVVDRFPGLVYVGWDIALLESGIMVVEANSYSGVQLIQLHQPLLQSHRLASFYRDRGVVSRGQFRRLFADPNVPLADSEAA